MSLSAQRSGGDVSTSIDCLSTGVEYLSSVFEQKLPPS